MAMELEAMNSVKQERLVLSNAEFLLLENFTHVKHHTFPT